LHFHPRLAGVLARPLASIDDCRITVARCACENFTTSGLAMPIGRSVFVQVSGMSALRLFCSGQLGVLSMRAVVRSCE
jgi:hypothetical protein